MTNSAWLRATLFVATFCWAGNAAAAGAFAKLQLLLPGETASPGSASGKTGTPTAQTAGNAFTVMVNAVDTNWNVVSSTDIVGITSSDTNAVLPGSAALVAGTQTFSVTLKTSGSRTVTATDISDGTKTNNTSPATTVNAATFSKLQLLMPGETAAAGTASGKNGAPTSRTAGTAFSVTVNAVDTNWNVVSSTHTVGITTSDSYATLPANAALVAGTKAFSVTFKTAGNWTVTATDISDGTKTANTSPATTASAGAFAKLQLLMPGETALPGSSTGKSGTPSLRTTGVGFTVTVNAVDANWNVASSTDTIRITSSDTIATLPANAALVAGTQTFTVILNTAASSRTVTATDMTDGAKTANTSPATIINLLWKGQSFTVAGTGASAITNADGSAELTRGSADASITLSAVAPTNAAGSLINIYGTPWIQWSYVDPGSNNVDIFIDDAVVASNPRLQAGSLFFYDALGYVRYSSNEEIPIVVGANTRTAGEVHTLYSGKRLDGTVDYKFDNVCYSSSLLTNVGAWDFDRVLVRLRSGVSGNKVVFTDFQYGDNHTNRTPTLTAITNPPAILEDAGQQTITLEGISAGIAEGQTLMVTATKDSPAVITNLAVSYSSPNTIGTVTYQPVPNANGTNVITVRVEYDGGPSNGGTNAVQRTFSVVVLPVNDAPTLASITNPAPILEGASNQTINLSGISAGGGETQTLIVTATSDNPALLTNLTVNYTSPAGSGTVSYQPAPNASGSTMITIHVEDDGGTTNGGVNWVEQSFRVVVQSLNHAPTVNLTTYNRAANLTAKILISNLLTNASDSDVGDTLVLQSVGSGTNSAVVTVSGSYVLYQPSLTNPNRNTDDHLEYAVSDGHGGSGTNQIRIRIIDPNPGSSGANISGIDPLGDGRMRVRFRGIPGYAYRVERTTSMDGENTMWTSIGAALEMPASSGYFEFEDTAPPQGQGYYRTVWP